MKIKKVLEDNPSIAEELRNFFTDVLMNSFKQNVVPDSFKELVAKGGVTINMVEAYLSATPRLMCDFMDTKAVLILITCPKNKRFSFTINGVAHKEEYDDRKEAEIESVIESVAYYKLTLDDND